MSLLLFQSKKGPSVDWSFLSALPTGHNFSRASSATYIGSNGVLKPAANNEPRFDYDPMTLQPRGLLIESEPRTNMHLYSNDPSGWMFLNCTGTANNSAGIDGLISAHLVVPNTSNTAHYVKSAGNQTYTNGVVYTNSGHFKGGGYNYVQLAFPSAVSTAYGNFDLVNGVVTQSSGCAARIHKATNGFLRCEISAAAGATLGEATCLFAPIPNGTSTRLQSNAGDGTSGIYATCLQTEAGYWASSYIPTTSAQVTRAADILNVTDLSPFDLTKGTILCEYQFVGLALGTATYPRPVSFNNNSGKRIDLQCDTRVGTDQGFAAYIHNGTVTQYDPLRFGSSGLLLPAKHALRYETNNARAAANGLLGDADASVLLPSGLTRLSFGRGADSSTNQYTSLWLKRFKYWNRSFTDTELIRNTQ